MKKNRICFRLNGQAIAFPLGLLSENEVRHRIALLRSANVPLDPDGVRHFLRTGQFPPPKPVEVLPAVVPQSAQKWTLRQILSWYLEQPGTLQKERDALAEQDRPHTYNLRRSLARFTKVIDLDRPPPLLPEDFQKYINARRFDPKHQIDRRNPDPESLRKEVGDVRALYNHWAINKVQPQVSRLVLDYGVKEDPDEFRPMSEVIEMIDRHGLTGDQARKLWHSSFPTVQEALDLLAHVRKAATQPWLPAITAWAIYTGCRASEARRAEVTDWEVERQAWSAREKKAKKGRIAAKAADLRLLVEAGSSFEEWLTWEAFLACKHRQASYPFCEVAAKPSYASEGVAGEGDADQDRGDLRVGGPNDGADHCWVFAEFVLLHDGNRTGGEWLRKVEADAHKLRRLGWKKSASLLVVAVAGRGDVLTEWAEDLAGCAVWNQPSLTDPFVIPLPGGGSVVLKALDIKRNPADTLAAAGN